MAKDQIHNYLRMFIILAGIVFAGGGYAMKISSNSERITDEKIERVKADEALTVKVDKTEDDVHLLALAAKDTQALAAKAVELFTIIQATQNEQARKSESAFKAIQTKLNDQGTVLAVNSTTLKTLTKD